MVAQQEHGRHPRHPGFTTEEDEHRRFVAPAARAWRPTSACTRSRPCTRVAERVIEGGTALVLWFAPSTCSRAAHRGEVLILFARIWFALCADQQPHPDFGWCRTRASARSACSDPETAPDLPDGRRGAARTDVHARSPSRTCASATPGASGAARDLVPRPAGEWWRWSARPRRQDDAVSLVPRFYDPDAGRVLLDGVDLRELRLRALRQQVGMVSSRRVFPTTIRENIATDAPDATAAQVEEAARLAQLDGSSPACRRGSRPSREGGRRCRGRELAHDRERHPAATRPY